MAETIQPALYMIATPIGNLADFSSRAQALVPQMAVVYAEDTRVSRVLLSHYAIHVPLRSFREAMPAAAQEAVAQEVIKALAAGQAVGFMSDAGTPGVSDPGNRLVAVVTAAGWPVIALPGASALTALLSVAGLPVLRPLFVGFLPKKKGRQTLLKNLGAALTSELTDAVVMFESPERVEKLLGECATFCKPDLYVVAARELTKRHETIYRGSLAAVRAELAAQPHLKGEWVLMITNPLQ